MSWKVMVLAGSGQADERRAEHAFRSSDPAERATEQPESTGKTLHGSTQEAFDEPFVGGPTPCGRGRFRPLPRLCFNVSR